MSVTTTTPPPPDPDYTSELTQMAQSLQAIQTQLTVALTTPRQLSNANEKYLSGSWARRDGTVYAPIIPVQQQPGALVR
jgi:hypothetical protein